MRIITLKRIREFAELHPDAAEPLRKWARIVAEAEWKSLHETRRVYPHADAVTVASGNSVTVFNLGGNKYRLIAAIHYDRQCLYVLRILRHAEYDKNRWKESL